MSGPPRRPRWLPRLVDRYLFPHVESLVERRTSAEVERVVRTSPQMVAKVMPISPDCDTLLVPGPDAHAPTGADGLPLPRREPWEHDSYLAGGARDVDRMQALLAAHGVDRSVWGDVLDFGCGSARMTRHLRDHAEEHEVWGVDINAGSMSWCEQNLSPPFHFAACSTFPSLPFEDRTFGLVIAGSVFTHISELARAWLLELRRVTAPGGHLYVTVQDQSYIAATAHDPWGSSGWTDEDFHRSTDVLSRLGQDLSSVAFGRSNKNAMVFYDRAGLVRSWGAELDILAVEDLGHDEQTVFIMRKRA